MEVGEVLWPTAPWAGEGLVVNGPAGTQGKMLEELVQWFSIDGGTIVVHDHAPSGRYQIEWNVDRPDGVEAFEIHARLYRANVNQSNSLIVDLESLGHQTIGSNNDDWKWQPFSRQVWLWSKDFSKPLRLRWDFTKPHEGHIWHVRLADLQVKVADAAEAQRRYLQPLAEGLPPLSDPRRGRSGWSGDLELRDGMMFKDGTPFFPIGFVRGTDEKTLAQIKSMGATAVSIGVGWNVSHGPGPVPLENFEGVLGQVRRAAAWDIASFVLLTGHYVPGWFRSAHDSAELHPLGSDGEMSGHWMAYSLHYQAFRDEIVHFWRAAVVAMAGEPSIMALNFWNEPCYGGSWAWPTQFADYQPFAVENYRKYLREKYATVELLSETHQQDYSDFNNVDPPKAPDEQSRQAWLDWMRYGQQYFADFFQWERQVIRSAAPTVRLTNKKQTNPWDNSTASSGTNWHLLAQSEDIFGLNIYWSSPSGIRDIIEGANCYAQGKPVISFETNCMPPPGQVSPDAARIQLWYRFCGW